MASSVGPLSHASASCSVDVTAKALKCVITSCSVITALIAAHYLNRIFLVLKDVAVSSQCQCIKVLMVDMTHHSWHSNLSYHVIHSFNMITRLQTSSELISHTIIISPGSLHSTHEHIKHVFCHSLHSAHSAKYLLILGLHHPSKLITVDQALPCGAF